jgi:hypothetical protein
LTGDRHVPHAALEVSGPPCHLDGPSGRPLVAHQDRVTGWRCPGRASATVGPTGGRRVAGASRCRSMCVQARRSSSSPDLAAATSAANSALLNVRWPSSGFLESRTRTASTSGVASSTQVLSARGRRGVLGQSGEPSGRQRHKCAGGDACGGVTTPRSVTLDPVRVMITGMTSIDRDPPRLEPCPDGKGRWDAR